MSFINKKLEEFNKFILNKKIAIIGIGVSNIPLIDYFNKYGANVTVFDNKDISQIDKNILNKIEKYNMRFSFGKDSLSKLEKFDIIFRSPSCMPSTPEIKKEVERGAILTTEIEMVLKLTPSKVIGVTGTEGKTTTTSLIYQILKGNGNTCYFGGNIGNPLFVEIEKMRPEDIVILELSSFQLIDMDISPEISVVTNIYPDHLNIHKSYEEYQNAKKNIFKHQNEEDITILNKDNEITYNFSKEVNGKKIFFSSKEKLNNGYIYDRDDGNIKLCEDGVRRHLLSKNDIKLRGIHNYENICAALAATSKFVDADTQIKAIKNFNGVEHRLEFVRELDNVKYYNDSIGTSPASTIAGLNAFDENIVLLAGGSDKGLDYKEVGETIAKKVGTLILTGPTAEKIEKATNEALKINSKKLNIIHCKDLAEAVSKAKEVAQSGDVVLLSPASASFDSYKNFMERGEKFKEIVNNL